MKYLFSGFGASKFPFEKEGKFVFQEEALGQGPKEAPKTIETDLEKQEKENKKITDAENVTRKLTEKGRWELMDNYPEAAGDLPGLDSRVLGMLEPKPGPGYEIKEQKQLLNKFNKLAKNIDPNRAKKLSLEYKKHFLERAKKLKDAGNKNIEIKIKEGGAEKFTGTDSAENLENLEKAMRELKELEKKDDRVFNIRLSKRETTTEMLIKRTKYKPAASLDATNSYPDNLWELDENMQKEIRNTIANLEPVSELPLVFEIDARSSEVRNKVNEKGDRVLWDAEDVISFLRLSQFRGEGAAVNIIKNFPDNQPIVVVYDGLPKDGGEHLRDVLEKQGRDTGNLTILDSRAKENKGKGVEAILESNGLASNSLVVKIDYHIDDGGIGSAEDPRLKGEGERPSWQTLIEKVEAGKMTKAALDQIEEAYFNKQKGVEVTFLEPSKVDEHKTVESTEYKLEYDLASLKYDWRGVPGRKGPPKTKGPPGKKKGKEPRYKLVKVKKKKPNVINCKPGLWRRFTQLLAKKR